MPQDRPAPMRSIRCNVLLVSPRFAGRSFWNLTATCEALGAKTAAPPLGLITVAAMLPKSWECRLVNRNAEELVDADLQWADMVMTGGMIPQRPDALAVIELAQAPGQARGGWWARRDLRPRSLRASRFSGFGGSRGGDRGVY